MNNSLNHFRLIAALLFVGLTTAARSQTAYEYAVIDFLPWQRILQVSINGETYTEKEIAKTDVQGLGDATAALREVRKMNALGWEVFGTSTISGAASEKKGYVFFLRKKIE
jgi:hypothetical protein